MEQLAQSMATRQRMHKTQLQKNTYILKAMVKKTLSLNIEIQF